MKPKKFTKKRLLPKSAIKKDPKSKAKRKSQTLKNPAN
jgi:hypothetical protein